MVIRYKSIVAYTLFILMNTNPLAAIKPEGSCRSPLENLTTPEKLVVTGSMGTVNAVLGTPFQHWKNALQKSEPCPPLKHLWRGTSLNIVRSTPSTLPEVLIMGNADAIIQKFQLPIACDTQKACLAFGAAVPGTGLNVVAEQLVMRKKYGQTCYAITKDICKKYGPMALLRGFTPKVIRDGTGSCAYWYAAPTLKEEYKKCGIAEPLATIAAGLSVAIPASIASHPFDTISTAMAHDLERKQYRHTGQTIVDYVRLHGMRGLFKGLVPRTISTGVRIPALCLVQDRVTRYFNNQRNNA